eukprot:snap_masked-scaffold_2-processed-gene-18.54-mRNA-1 protein AED:0.79 eAED:0.80 QI:0/-1/0/1/-1/1/1/0/268
MFVTGLLNPWDRALYLSLTRKRPFLHKSNFTAPYQGLSQTLVQRSLSTGFYFPLEDFFLSISSASDSLSKNSRNALAGNCAGMINGLILNPLSYIKYKSWGSNRCKEHNAFINKSKYLLRRGGHMIFYRGALATCLRDAIFGGAFSVVRNLDFEQRIIIQRKKKFSGRKERPFLQDVFSAAVGTILSSPLNYVRNIQYHSKSSLPSPSFIQVFRVLGHEVRTEHDGGRFARLRVVQHRLRIGWGTLRVAIGMGMVSKLYSMCHRDLDT